jgi:hypothetical protein
MKHRLAGVCVLASFALIATAADAGTAAAPLFMKPGGNAGAGIARKGESSALTLRIELSGGPCHVSSSGSLTTNDSAKDKATFTASSATCSGSWSMSGGIKAIEVASKSEPATEAHLKLTFSPKIVLYSPGDKCAYTLSSMEGAFPVPGSASGVSVSGVGVAARNGFCTSTETFDGNDEKFLGGEKPYYVETLSEI